jgi:hypothetical protein
VAPVFEGSGTTRPLFLKGEFSMSMQALSQRGAGAMAEEGKAAAFLRTVSSFWFGNSKEPKVVDLYWLDPIQILYELKSGKQCRYGDWTIRQTPPRYVRTEGGQEVWVSSLWVSSEMGFTTFSPMSIGTVESAMAYIERRDVERLKLDAHNAQVLPGMDFVSSMPMDLVSMEGGLHG